MIPRFTLVAVAVVLALVSTTVQAFSIHGGASRQRQAQPACRSPLFKPLAAATVPAEKDQQSKKNKAGGYEPKWKKKATLADQMGGATDGVGFDKVGLQGTIKVEFRQGNETKITMARPGQPLRTVASQAGQFIKYGCGKGECGTCEALVDGKWIRPCSSFVPDALPDTVDAYVVQVKEQKSKTVSSGKFYSLRSFFRGFWNNLLGMVGFLRGRRASKRNWSERLEYEDLIKQKTMEKKRQRLMREQQQQQQQGGSDSNHGRLSA